MTDYVWRLVPLSEEAKNTKYYSVPPLSKRLYHKRRYALSARLGAGFTDKDYRIEKAELKDWQVDE